MKLNAITELQTLNDRYSSSERTGKAHILLIGEKGVGKTSIAETCPGPVLVHSFDPDGTSVLADGIKSEKVFVDTQFERDDYRNPTAYKAWEAEFNRLGQGGVFDQIGTYFFDGLTMFADAALHQLMAGEGRILPGMMTKTNQEQQGMRIQDWGKLANCLQNCFQRIINLSCHSVVIGHYERSHDKDMARMIRSLLLPGKAAPAKIPKIAPELWVLVRKAAGFNSQSERYLLTQAEDEYFDATTRLGYKGRLNAHEPPDIQAILKKVGYDWENITLEESKEKKES